jgi:hypothetical protein
MALNGCAACVKKQRELARLPEARQRLTQTLRSQERQGLRVLRVAPALRQPAGEGPYGPRPVTQPARGTGGARRGWSPDMRGA